MGVGFLCGIVIFFCMLVLTVWESLYIGLILGLVSVSVSLVLGISISSVVGYFVFLIYVGGLMVLFGYVLSVFPNQFFELGFLPGNLGFVVVVVCVFSGFSFKWGSSSNVGEFISCWGSGYMYLFVGGFLLFILLLVVSLCNKRQLPLRGGL